MAKKTVYSLIYDPQVRDHVARIEKKYHSLIRKEIERQLRYEPEVETKNRKPLLRPSSLGSAWELRTGPENRFRVFYKADRELWRVNILAIGVKIKERLYIGGKEFEL
ncbi:MAG: addiction module toxin RelE [Deltaproteobacteria bacterium]|nr:addiction module toxin RelE [Deltaproteobacteria bacterium]